MKKIFVWVPVLVVVFSLCLLISYLRRCNNPSNNSEVAIDNTSEYLNNEKIGEHKMFEIDLGDDLEEDYGGNDDVGENPVDRYFAESERIHKLFSVRKEQLKESSLVIGGRRVDNYYERYEEGFYRPLYREVKKAMARVLGTADYLAFWENLTLVQDISKSNKSITIPYAGEISLDLLTIYSLAILYENRENILKSTVYEDSEIGDQYRKNDLKNLWFLFKSDDSYENAILTTGRAFLGTEEPAITEYIRSSFHKMNIWLIFPPRYSVRATFDPSWHIMAIYSFKNERSRKILYDIATNNIDDRFLISLARFATFYLPLSYDSNDFIPSLNALLKTDFEQFYNQCPEQLKEKLDGKEVDNLTNNEFNNILNEFKNEYPWIDIFSNFCYDYMRRLLKLRDSLLFNEKIPLSERDRFEVVRRELAVSWALSDKFTIFGPRAEVILKKGEEHFVEYLREYYVPGPTPSVYYFEEHE